MQATFLVVGYRDDEHEIELKKMEAGKGGELEEMTAKKSNKEEMTWRRSTRKETTRGNVESDATSRGEIETVPTTACGGIETASTTSTTQGEMESASTSRGRIETAMTDSTTSQRGIDAATLAMHVNMIPGCEREAAAQRFLQRKSDLVDYIKKHYEIPFDFKTNRKYGQHSGLNSTDRMISAYEWGIFKPKTEMKEWKRCWKCAAIGSHLAREGCPLL